MGLGLRLMRLVDKSWPRPVVRMEWRGERRRSKEMWCVADSARAGSGGARHE